MRNQALNPPLVGNSITVGRTNPHWPVVQDFIVDVDSQLDATFKEIAQLLGREFDPSNGDGLARAGVEFDLVAELAHRANYRGKRIRPLSAYWGYVAGGGEVNYAEDSIIRVGAALDLLHLFALIQDDVMDRSDSRRGEKTLHVTASEVHEAAGALGDPVLFGDSVAVLVADLALSEASMLIGACSRLVHKVWRLMTIELVEGQFLDITHTAGRRREVEVSARIARYKSGRYTITRPIQLGALVARASPVLVDRLVAWGDLVGEAFAVRDDILGVWGDPVATGKPSGDDLRSGKPTLLLTWADELIVERSLLAACNEGRLNDVGVAELQEAMRRGGVLERAEDHIAALMVSADDLLGTLLIPEPAAEALRDLSRNIAWRRA